MQRSVWKYIKYSLLNKSLQLSFIVVYDFEIKIVETKLKVGELRKIKDELCTVKTGWHIPTGYALAVYYLEEV